MKLIISIGFLTFLLSPFITSAQTTPSMDETIAEESTNTVVVNTGRDSKINVRETTGGKRLGTQKNGAVGVIIDGPVIVKKRSWHKIDFITGVDGWVVLSMLEMQAEPAPAFLLISQSVESVTDTTALITYQLSEAGTGQIEYGTTQNLGTLNNKDNSLNYSIHRQTLLNLTPKTTYYYQITSENAAGVSVTSDIKSFTTNAPPVYAFSNGDTITVNTGDGSNINIRATANGTLLGQQPDSALGTVVGGPVTTGSFVWWNIDFNSGVDGWAAEDFIQAYVPPAPAPTPAPATLLFEAESMLLSSPMQTKQTEGETVIYSSTAGAGTAIKIITIPSTGLYNLRVHAKTPNTGSDSFYFTIGTNAQRTFSTPINTSLAWITYSAGLSLTEGNTTLTILTREPNVEIDKVELVPVGSSAQ